MKEVTAINTETADTIIGSRIKSRRLTLGLTQRDLAHAAGLSVSFISDTENGKRGVSVSSLVALASALRVSPCWFFRNVESRS